MNIGNTLVAMKLRDAWAEAPLAATPAGHAGFDRAPG
jgi:hypothetical protein